MRRGDPIRDLVRGLRDLIRADGCQGRFRAHCRRPRAAGAAPARQYVFFAFGPNYYVDRPLVGRASHSRLVPRSPLGQDAGGARAQRATSLNSTSPAWRAASATEIMDFLNARGLAGYPPSVTADAQLGFSLLRPCEGSGSIWVRLIKLARGVNWPDGLRRDIAHAMQMRRTTPYRRGAARARGLRLRREQSLLAERRSAACNYAKTLVYPPLLRPGSTIPPYAPSLRICKGPCAPDDTLPPTANPEMVMGDMKQSPAIARKMPSPGPRIDARPQTPFSLIRGRAPILEGGAAFPPTRPLRARKGVLPHFPYPGARSGEVGPAACVPAACVPAAWFGRILPRAD